MRFVHPEYHLDIKMAENQITIVVVESPQVFADVIQEIFAQIQGKEGLFVLSDRDKTITISKEAEMIFHPFALNCNEKRMQQKLYQAVSAVAEEEFVSETVEINAHVVSYLDELLAKLPYGLTFELEMNVSGLLKLYAVRVECSAENLLEQVVNYLRCLQTFCHTAVVFFVNLKTYLNESELLLLYQFVYCNKIQVILLENMQREPLQGENICILDKDMCIIES